VDDVKNLTVKACEKLVGRPFALISDVPGVVKAFEHDLKSACID